MSGGGILSGTGGGPTQDRPGKTNSGAVREVLASVESSLILGESDSLGIAVGFDSGDFILLGKLTHDGLIPIDPDSEPPEPLVEPVLERLRSSDSRKVFLAVFDLQRFDDRARQAVPDLLRFASTSDEFGLRQAAVNTLAAIAPEDPRAKAAVLRALNDSNPFVRREATSSPDQDQAIVSEGTGSHQGDGKRLGQKCRTLVRNRPSQYSIAERGRRTRR